MGGIANSGTLTVDSTTVGGTSATAANSAANGGGIFSTGKLTVQNASIIEGNTATISGGGFDLAGGTVSIGNSTITANTATKSNGGGIYLASGSSTVKGSSTVQATDSLYNNNGFLASGSTTPASIALPTGSGRVLTLNSVTGTITLDGSNFVNADGGSYSLTNITAANGISGMVAPNVGFLSGVFLNGKETGSQTAPASLDFTSSGLGEVFTSLSPSIDQVFFIGDGLTGTGTGTLQQFNIPDTATALVLGIVDGIGYSGPPGSYQDNSGTFSATYSIIGTTVPTVTLQANTISSNSAGSTGGTIGVAAGNLTVIDGTISANTASKGGGGIYFDGGGSLTLQAALSAGSRSAAIRTAATAPASISTAARPRSQCHLAGQYRERTPSCRAARSWTQESPAASSRPPFRSGVCSVRACSARC